MSFLGDGYPSSGLVVLDDDLVLVDFDDPRAVVGYHLVEYLIHYAFILEPGEIVDFIEVKGIDGITGFVDTPDLNVLGQVGPLLETVSVQHDIGFKLKLIML